MKTVFMSLFKEGFGGGEGRVAHEIAHKFATQHDTVLICPGDQTGLQGVRDGLKIYHIRSAGEGNVYVPALTTKIVNRIFHFLDAFQPDIIHAHEPLSTCLIGQIWAKMHGVPFVHTAHLLPSKALDFGAVEMFKILKSSLGESLARQGFSNFFENCDAIIALNKYAAQDIRQFGYKGRLFTIPNGRNLRKYGACANADLAAPTKILTFVGKLSERKNQRYLIEMLTHLPRDYRLVLIGEPLAQAYQQELSDLARQHQVDVVLTGEIDHHIIPAYLTQTHAFVSASRMEVQSLVIIEALASGTPVIGLSNETVDELVDETVGCLLPKETSPEVFARWVERMCGLPQVEYSAMCNRARARVEHLDWSNVMDQTVEAYETLIREMTPMTESSRTRLEKTLALVPPGEVRELIAAKIASLEKTIHNRVKPETEKLTSGIRRMKLVPGSSWLVFLLTIPLSLLAYMAARYWASTRRLKRARKRHQRRRWMDSDAVSAN